MEEEEEIGRWLKGNVEWKRPHNGSKNEGELKLPSPGHSLQLAPGEGAGTVCTCTNW